MTEPFSEVSTVPGCAEWDTLIRRQHRLYKREGDIRSEFARDYTRILHCRAFRRMKQKTQVFFNIDNDHICTRMEHVLHVESVSCTIAKTLGLNVELTQAISMGHDLGHAPFAHQGERILSELSEKYLHQPFWHEKNGLHFVDDVELLEDNKKKWRNLDLTYAVRDGIIAHCGEVDENGLRPRKELMPLEFFKQPGQFAPATWEACVVKISDKIAYVGRDIEDAAKLHFLNDDNKKELKKIARSVGEGELNTTVIIYDMIADICKNSSPEAGICLSADGQAQLKEIKDFNYKYIYRNERLRVFNEYAHLVLTKIFEILYGAYSGAQTIDTLIRMANTYRELCGSFADWLMRYCVLYPKKEYDNHKIYGALETEELYAQAILDYMSGMTDGYAITVFNELITY